jgi:hypothetical protein
MKKIGWIYANIAGDHRYGSCVAVFRDAAGEVGVERSENGAVGGMDGPGGAYPMLPKEIKFLGTDPKPADLVRAIKEMFDDTITRYGKPTKRFHWCTGKTGLSAALAREALSS